MANSKPKAMPVWFGPALLVSGLLTMFGLIRKAKDEGIIKDEKP